jgi:hypothetical protein
MNAIKIISAVLTAVLIAAVTQLFVPTDRVVVFYEFGTERYLAVGTSHRKCEDAKTLVKGLPGADLTVRGDNGTLYRAFRIACIKGPKR